MKTVKNNDRSIVLSTVQKLMASILLVTVSVGCSKDDGPTTSINAQAQTFTVNGVNNCNTSLGDGSTFVFKIPYTSSDGIAINKLLIKTIVSDGGSKEGVNTNFTDSNGTIEWVSCFTFGSQDWVEYEVRLEASDGSISNISTVRVNKPNGAN